MQEQRSANKLNVAIPVPAPVTIVCCMLLLLLIPASCMGGQKTDQQLVIKHGQTGEIAWSRDISDGEEFSLRYIHSVDKLPVYEFYMNKHGQLVLTGIKVIDFGAGLDYTGEGDLRMEGKWTYIENLNRKIDSLPLRVGSIADHTLIYRGKEFHLWDYFPTFTLVRMEIR
ncbi:MAG: DUF1850 domain-containing protein [Desulfovermiculus sp.]|nr:DUF1850 domain-containing protein [Desulfovermiculus sp.]